MRKTKHWLWLTAMAGLLPTGMMAQTSPVETEKRTVATEKEAFIALPPELVAEPVVTQFTISNGGRYALVERKKQQVRPEFPLAAPAEAPAPSEISLVLWDSKAHLSTTVWHGGEDDTRVDGVTWLSGSEVAFVQISQSVPLHPELPQGEKTLRTSLLRVAPNTGRADEINLAEIGQPAMLTPLSPSPTVPLAIMSVVRLQSDRHARWSLYLLDERGQIGAHVDLPPGVSRSDIEWSTTGQPLIHVAERAPDKTTMIQTWCAMNTATGELSPLPKDQIGPKGQPTNMVMPKSPRALPLRLKAAQAQVKEGETAQLASLLWLESVTQSEKPRILLTSDGTDGQLMARGEMVLFQSQGAVWATPLLHIDLAAYAALKRQADRVRTMTRAKQAALAVLMFTQDNDEIMPTADGLAANLAPYLNDPSILEGFNYTYAGGPLSEIANPGQTVIGTMNGGSGQAIIYSDGHVKWQ